MTELALVVTLSLSGREEVVSAVSIRAFGGLLLGLVSLCVEDPRSRH